MPRHAITVAAPHYHTMVIHLQDIVDGARIAAARHGPIAAFARTAHALRHSDPAVVFWLGAAAITQLATAEEQL